MIVTVLQLRLRLLSCLVIRCLALVRARGLVMLASALDGGWLHLMSCVRVEAWLWAGM